MNEFYRPQPIVLEREVREVNGVLESVVTESGNVTHSEHLRREKSEWVNQHLFECAQLASSLGDEQRLAAD